MMSSGPSLILSNNANHQPTMNFLLNISVGSFVTISNFSIKTGIDYLECIKVLEELSKSGFLEKWLAFRCPECGLLLKTVKPEDYAIESQYCTHCDMDVDIVSDSVEVLFKVVNNPFATGQENKTIIPEHSSALKNSSLETFLKNGGNFNSELFCPSDEEYQMLAEKFNNIFKPHSTTKGKGDSLESLVLSLFRCCKIFKATDKIRLADNQIDCFIRNKCLIPFISQICTNDFFVIECKNEQGTPGITYFNKLHSILINNSLQFGIIISKKRAAKTLNSFAHKIFLQNKMIMINLDCDDIERIIIDKVNLLECLERKIAEVKFNASADLIKLGLFDG